jgi:hypothetical protein
MRTMPTRSVTAAIIFIRPSHAGHVSASTPLYPPEQPRLVDARPLRRRLPLLAASRWLGGRLPGYVAAHLCDRRERNHGDSPRRVRREHPMVTNQRSPGRSNHRAQPAHELHRRHHPVGRCPAARCLHPVRHVAVGQHAHPPRRHRRPRHVPAQPLQRVAISRLDAHPRVQVEPAHLRHQPARRQRAAPPRPAAPRRPRARPSRRSARRFRDRPPPVAAPPSRLRRRHPPLRAAPDVARSSPAARSPARSPRAGPRVSAWASP